MSTTVEYYNATIPAVVILKEIPEAVSLIDFLISNNIGKIDGDGFHFHVERSVLDDFYRISDAPHNTEMHGDHYEGEDYEMNSFERLVDDLCVQLVHMWTYDSGDYEDPREKEYEYNLMVAFYEGLFAHALSDVHPHADPV